MTYEKWFDIYRPVINKQGNLFVYETFGDDVKKIRKTDPNYIWTVTDQMGILPGIHYVNRLYYVITKVPHGQEDIYVDDEAEAV